MDKTYVVTGDRGFVGSRLARRIIDAGKRVVGVDLQPPKLRNNDLYAGTTVDLSNEHEVADMISSCGDLAAVFHMAAKLPDSDDDPLEAHLSSNLRPMENLLKALDGRGVPLIMSSTMSVFGLQPATNPVSEDVLPSPCEAYGLSKLAAECSGERMARAGRVPVIVLRYAGIFGVGYEYGAVHLYASRAMAGESVDVYASGALVRDYVHVDDIVEVNLLAAERAGALGWGLFHVGGGEPRPLREIAELVVQAVGGGEIRINDAPGSFDFGFDISRARRDLGFAPIALRDRICQYVEDMQKEGAFDHG